MELLSELLPIIIYFLLIIFIIIGIIIGIKIIRSMNKFEIILTDVEKKIRTLDGFFGILDFTTDKLAIFSDKLVDFITGIIMKIFKKKETKEEETNE